MVFVSCYDSRSMHIWEYISDYYYSSRNIFSHSDFSDMHILDYLRLLQVIGPFSYYSRDFNTTSNDTLLHSKLL